MILAYNGLFSLIVYINPRLTQLFFFFFFFNTSNQEGLLQPPCELEK